MRRAHVAVQAERGIEGVAPQQPPGDAELQRHHDRSGRAAARCAHPGPRCLTPGGRQAQAQHQYGSERHLQCKRTQLQQHHDLRARDRGVEPAKCSEEQRKGQCDRKCGQVPAHLHRHLWGGVRQTEKGLREQQHRAAQAGDQQCEPHRLVQLRAGFDALARAEQLAGNRSDGEHRAHQGDEYRHVDRTTDGQGGQVER